MRKKEQKILAYDPYIDNFGGGEKYFLDTLNALLSKGFDITLYSKWSTTNLDTNFRDRFGYGLYKPINIIYPRFGNKFITYVILIIKSIAFEYFLTVTNEFPQISLSKNSVVILQYPYIKKNSVSKIRKYLHYFFYDTVITYSKYVKEIVKSKKIHSKDVVVVSPYIKSVEGLTSVSMKKNKIICVGRFIEDENSKGQQFAIDCFKKIVKNSKFKGLNLCLVGGANERSNNFIRKLKERSKGLDVRFYTNASREILESLYLESSVYWHLAGYNQDLNINPGRAEHFGITVLESIQNSCVPLVFNAGGPVEILGAENQDFFWNDIDQLATKTEKILMDNKYRVSLIRTSRKRLELYSQEKFSKKILSLF